MKSNLLSIVIPTFNRASTLPRLFASLLEISYSPIEIVLVDNQSTDNSLDLCLDFQRLHTSSTRTIKVTTEKEKGACYCRNKGISLTQGEFIYFFDSDDEMSPTFLENLYPYCKDNDLVCAPTVMYFEDGSRKVRSCIPSHHVYDHILSASLSTQSMLIRREVLIKYGNWDTHLPRWNDWELGVRLLCSTRKVKWLTSQAYHKIYQHKKSISGKSFGEDYENLLASISKAEADIRSSALDRKEVKKSLNALAAKCLLLCAELYREGNLQKEKECYHFARTLMQDAATRILTPVIYFFNKHHLPGSWRLYLALCKCH